MAITLELMPEEEQRLRQKAEMAGQDVTTYLLTRVGMRIAARPPLTDAEWECLVEELVSIIGPEVPPLSDYALSREGMYEGRY